MRCAFCILVALFAISPLGNATSSKYDDVVPVKEMCPGLILKYIPLKDNVTSRLEYWKSGAASKLIAVVTTTNVNGQDSSVYRIETEFGTLEETVTFIFEQEQLDKYLVVTDTLTETLKNELRISLEAVESCQSAFNDVINKR